MKKSLVLAMAMALGVTASAYAANPFSDVPAGHWAYDSIAKLAAAGVIEGYGDDTFRGDRLMTRFEMAQIVAKAMAKGANVDKLAAEFADELDKLNVRVAALEKKADNVKITGQFRYHYAHHKRSNYGANDHEEGLRSRIWFNGKVNDNWTYVAMLQNYQDLTNNVGDEGTRFQRAYVDGRIGGVMVRAGRHDFQLGDANLYDTRMDGVKISYGNKLKFGAYYGKPADGVDLTNGAFDPQWVSYDKFFGANLGYDIGKLSLNVAYDKFKNANLYNAAGAKLVDASNMLGDNGVWSVQATYNFGKASLGAIFLKSDVDLNTGGLAPNDNASNKGVVVTATYGGAESAKVGSWGLTGKYYNQGVGTFIAHTMDGKAQDFVMEGFKGWSIAGDVTVGKNMIATVEYFDIKGKETNGKAKTLWTQLAVTF